MEIRKATEKDVPDLIGLWKELHNAIEPLIKDRPVLLEYNKQKPNAPEVFEEEIRENLGKEGHFVLLAEEGGKLFGYLTANVKERGKSKAVDKVMYIHHLLVSKEARGKGVGSALVKEIERTAKGMGIGFVLLKTLHSCPEVVGFYLKNGFEKRFIEMVKKI